MDDIKLMDIADNLLIINKTTIERLFQLDNQNALILYLFYYKTAKWQKNSFIKASDDYCKKCLHWGIDKLQTTKKKLREMGLIEPIRKTDLSGKVIGWYIKLNYFINETTIPETTIPISPHVVKQETNTINNNNKILNNNINNNKVKYGKYGRVKLTKDEYTRLIDEFGEDFITNQIKLLDEYVESNNNKNKYSNFNLVLRKSIRENWFNKKQNNNKSFIELMRKEREKYDN